MNAESNMYNPWKSVEISTDFHGECFSYVYVHACIPPVIQHYRYRYAVL